MEEIIVSEYIASWLIGSIIVGFFLRKVKGLFFIAPLLIAGIPAAAQLIGGLLQKNKANNLKKSNYVPPQLLMNKDLAAQQAYSRRAPGSAFAEEQNRRGQANQIASAQRSFGGDANKIAAVTAGAMAQTQDANSRIAAQGQQFSENAFGRLSNANTALAANDRQNQSDYLQTKNALDNAGNTNIFGGISNLATAGLLAKADKGSTFAKSALGLDEAASTDPNDQYPRFNQSLRRLGNGLSTPGRYNQRARRVKLAY